MHPEIDKFWRNTTKEIRGYQFSQHQMWFLVSDPDYYNQGGPPPPKGEDMICQRWLGLDGKWNKAYYLQNEVYTEKEMLKIIKLKAFL